MTNVLFVHIPKTGGSTVVNNLTPLIEAAGLKLRHGHLDVGRFRKHLATSVSFTVLREPTDRLLSLYWYGRRSPTWYGRLAQRLPPRKFFTHPAIGHHPAFCDGMSHQLGCSFPMPIWTEHLDPIPVDADQLLTAACRTLDALDYVGATATVDATLRAVCELLGLPSPVHIGRSNHSPRGLVDPAVYGVLEPLVQVDRQLWKHAMRGMVRRCGSSMGAREE